MSDDAKRKAARNAVEAAQKQFEREQNKSRVARRKAFVQDPRAVLSRQATQAEERRRQA
jgi:hypothetical protein